jgi:hypothetical protein
MRKKLEFELTHVTKIFANFPGLSLEKEYVYIVCIYIYIYIYVCVCVCVRARARLCLPYFLYNGLFERETKDGLFADPLYGYIYIYISFRILLVFSLSSQINTVTCRGDYKRRLDW